MLLHVLYPYIDLNLHLNLYLHFTCLCTSQGFTTSYANLLNGDEYGSALSRVQNLNPAKILNDFKVSTQHSSRHH